MNNFFKKQMKVKNKNRNMSGFTLLEMLISITLFTIVVTVAMTALLSIMNVNEKAKTIKLVVNNLGMAMESMTREIRVGYEYNCNGTSGGDCSSGGTIIYFKTKEKCDGYYKYDILNETIVRKVEQKVGNACTNPSEVAIVGDDINIRDMKFYVVGTASGDGVQPKVLIKLKGSVGILSQNKLDTIFNIQTTISQRKLAP